ncbi:MAG: hypothetical protein KDC95_12970 [Planctomycetes bacterium]|nr:hypothetical protein [Planctomycetota bacterium]
MHTLSARRIAAAERAQLSIRAESDLDSAARDEVLANLEEHRAEVAAAARQLVRTSAPSTTVSSAKASNTQPEGTLAVGTLTDAIAMSHAASPTSNDTTSTHGTERAATRVHGPRRPSLWSRLGPVFAENLLFALAGFLLVAGAIYFTTTAWTTMSGTMQKLVVSSSVLLFGLLLHGAGHVVNKGQGLKTAARALSLVGVAVAPAASIVAGLLLRDAPQLALAAAAITAICGTLALGVFVRREGIERSTGVTAVSLYAGLVFSSVFAPNLGAVRVLVSCSVAFFPPIVAWWISSRRREGAAAVAADDLSGDNVSGDDIAVTDEADERNTATANHSRDRTAELCAVFSIALAVFALVAGIALTNLPPLVPALAPLGVALAATCFALGLLLDSTGTAFATWRTIVFAGATAAVAVASGDLRCLMLAAWFAACTGIQTSLKLDRAGLLLPALALAAVGYLFLPAPVRELAMTLRARAAEMLDYEPQRLPLSFYGISFLPYLFGLTWLVRWLDRRDKPRHVQMATMWTISVACGLAAMALVLGRDMRAPMAVLPADGAILILLGYVSRSRKSIVLGSLGVAAGFWAGLRWYEAPAEAYSVVFAAVSTALMLVAAKLASLDPATESRRFARDSATLYEHVAIAITGLMSLVWISGTLPDELGNTPYRVEALLHASLLVPIFTWLRRSDPERALDHEVAAPTLPLPAVLLTTVGVAGALEGVGIGPHADLLPLAFAAVILSVATFLPRLIGGSEPHAHRVRRNLAVALVSLLAGALPHLVRSLGSGPASLTWTHVAGLSLSAVASVWLALRVRSNGLLAATTCIAVASSCLVGGTWTSIGVEPDSILSPRLLLGPAIATFVVARLWGARRFVRETLAVSALAIVSWAVIARIVPIPTLPATDRTWASPVVLVLVTLAGARARRTLGGVAFARTLWVVTVTLVVALAPFALLDPIAPGIASSTGLASSAIYALVLLGLAVVVRSITLRDSMRLVASCYAAWLTAFAVLLLLVWIPATTTHEWLRACGFAFALLMAAACRPRALRVPTTLIALAATYGIAVDSAIRLRFFDAKHWLTAVLLLCAATAFATRLRRFERRKLAVLAVAAPVFAVTIALSATWIVIHTFGKLVRGPSDIATIDGIAIGVLLLGIALALHVRARLARITVLLAGSLALLMSAPLSGIFDGTRVTLLRPDIEAGLLATTLAIAAHTFVRSAPWTLAVLAALWTGFRLTDVTTPITWTLVTCVPMTLRMRAVRGPWLFAFGCLVLVTTWSWIVFIDAPRGINDARRVLPWFALVAAVLPSFFAFVFRGLPSTERRFGVLDQLAALRATFGVAALCSAMAFAAFATRSVPAWELLPSTGACALVAFHGLSAMRQRGREGMLHVALFAAVVAYVIVMRGSDVLARFDGLHHRAFTILGATLFALARERQTQLPNQARGAAVLCVLTGILLGIAKDDATYALLTGGGAMAIAAALVRSTSWTASSLSLVNAGLFHYWNRHGIEDPSFYGVSAGLSILFGAEFVRRSIGSTNATMLRVLGLTTIYGSVLIQIARVSVPMHAAILFAIALLVVFYGLWQKNTPLLVVSIIAIVLDVIAYLAQRGFEQDFFGSMLLVAAGIVVFAVAARGARRRAKGAT